MIMVLYCIKSKKLLHGTIQSSVFICRKDGARVIILLSPANSQCEFAPNSQYCEFQAELAANSRCERIRSKFGEFKLNSLRICIPSCWSQSPGCSSCVRLGTTT